MGILRLLSKLFGLQKIQMSEAIGVGDIHDVRKLLMQGIDVNQTGIDGSTYLMIASTIGHTEIAKLLVQEGAVVDAVNKKKMTALMVAAYHGFASITELLLQNHANVNCRDVNGATPLLLAVIDGNKDSKNRMSIVSALVSAGADVNLKDFSNRSPLGAALYFNHGKVADFLRKAGARE